MLQANIAFWRFVAREKRNANRSWCRRRGFANTFIQVSLRHPCGSFKIPRFHTAERLVFKERGNFTLVETMGGNKRRLGVKVLIYPLA